MFKSMFCKSCLILFQRNFDKSIAFELFRLHYFSDKPNTTIPSEEIPSTWIRILSEGRTMAGNEKFAFP